MVKRGRDIIEMYFAKRTVSCERDNREQLADDTQLYGDDENPLDNEGEYQLSNDGEHPMGDNTEQPGDGNNHSAYDDAQLNTNNQNLRTRNCTKLSQALPTHFQSERDTIFLKDEVGDDVVGSLGRPHDRSLSEFSNISLSTQAHFAAKGLMIKNEPLENDKAVGTEVKCKDDSFDEGRCRTGSIAEAHTQSQRLDFMKVQDVKSIVIKPTAMTSQSKIEECPGPQPDDLKEPMAIVKGELRSSTIGEILNNTKKRVPEEDVSEQKLEKIQKRKLSAISKNPFTATTAVNGQMAEVQPQELWLNAPPCDSTYKPTAEQVSLLLSQLTCIELPSIGRLPLFAEILGQKKCTWIAELIEAREYEHRCFVLLRWMYRPRDLPAKQQNLKDRGKFELVLSDHFGIIDEKCIMRSINVIDWRAYNNLLRHDEPSYGGSYYFRQTYNRLKKELSVGLPISI